MASRGFADAEARRARSCGRCSRKDGTACDHPGSWGLGSRSAYFEGQGHRVGDGLEGVALPTDRGFWIGPRPSKLRLERDVEVDQTGMGETVYPAPIEKSPRRATKSFTRSVDVAIELRMEDRHRKARA